MGAVIFMMLFVAAVVAHEPATVSAAPGVPERIEAPPPEPTPLPTPCPPNDARVLTRDLTVPFQQRTYLSPNGTTCRPTPRPGCAP